ncbi:PTS sugar transporter subunit IIA [Streptomyces sp. NPDC058000]|uniref:PTS sugar transporter subunit IIA n=1 Tax=Streptomyces sp. NPDC058000 TaxID=3346299 RepID=UPI0036EA0846
MLRTALSWVRPTRLVPFGHETNDPVRLVVALAARDRGAHTAALAALAHLLADPDAVQGLGDAPDPESPAQTRPGPPAWHHHPVFGPVPPPRIRPGRTPPLRPPCTT